jgi:hypothetical protein
MRPAYPGKNFPGQEKRDGWEISSRFRAPSRRFAPASPLLHSGYVLKGAPFVTIRLMDGLVLARFKIR